MSGGFVAAAAIVGAAGSYMSAREQRKVAEKASKPQETVSYRTPYMNEYISRVSPYILSEAQKMYENRLKQYGMKPGDFSPIAQMLSGISTDYSGVGKPGSPIGLSGGVISSSSGPRFAPSQNPFSSSYESPSAMTQEQMKARRSYVNEALGGGEMGGNGGMAERSGMADPGSDNIADLIQYWR